jgi:hypothetical protein
MKRIYLIMVVVLMLVGICGQAVAVSADTPFRPSSGNNSSANSIDVLSTEQLVSNSDTIVVGTVSATNSHWNANHTLIITDATVAVDSVLKGDQKQPNLNISQVGGTADGITLQVSSSSFFSANEKAVLFLKKEATGAFSMTGGKQGKLAVVKDYVDTNTRLSDYKKGIQQLVSNSGRTNSRTLGAISTMASSPIATITTAQATTTPTITTISPATGSAGTNTRVTIGGTGFGTAAGGVTFFYKSGQPLINATVNSWSDTSITVTVPVGTINGYSATASSGPVQVTAATVASNNYQFGVTFSTLGVKWAGTAPQVHFKVNPAWISGAGTAVQNAAQSWSSAGANFQFVSDGTTTVTAAGYDGVNEILSANLGAGILASTYSWWDGANNLREFDMVFNTYYTWNTTGTTGSFDVQSVATHELGHALGLRDLYGNSGTPNDAAKAMYGYGSTTAKRNLTQADKDGITYIYGGATSPATIAYSPTGFNFMADEGGTNTAAQTLNIHNSGGGTLTWSLSSSAAWLTVSPTSGTSGATDNAVAIAANVSGMAAGSYNAAITIAATGATNTPVTVPVTLTINAAVPTIAYSPSNLGFVVDGVGASAESQTINIYNSGNGVLGWSASASNTWLSLSPASGTGTGEVIVSAETSGMVPGSYDGMITITASGAINNPVQVPVTLTINAVMPTIGYSPSELSFTADEGSGNPADQIINVYNNGSGILNWSASTSEAWLSVSPSSGSDSGAFIVSADISGMGAGSYNGSIIIAASGAINTPVTVPVTLTINAIMPTVGYNPSNLNFTDDEGGINPASQVINISNSGSGVLNWSVSASSTWLSVNPASGSGSGTVTVAANTSGMVAGSYNDIITITATGATNTPVMIPVSLTINSAVSPLGLALDNTNCFWTTGGNAEFFAQTRTAYYGGSAVQSGAIGTNSYSSISTTVTGAGTLTFYWKISSKTNSGYLRFYIDGVEKNRISGSLNWQKKTFTLGAGTHTIEWSYTRNGTTATYGSNCAWIDKVQFD